MAFDIAMPIKARNVSAASLLLAKQRKSQISALCSSSSSSTE